MTTAAEAVGAASPLNAALVAGVENISQSQTVEFLEYSRQVLPLDGYIFWLKTGRSFKAAGSFHMATTLEQRESETLGVNHVVFTAQEAIQDLNAIKPNSMYIGSADGMRYAFSRTKNFYVQAGLYHYMGDAVNPIFDPQIVDDPATLDLTNVIVSNSLPVWLMLGSTTTFGLTPPTFPIYPSFLVPQNVAPPYASVHIGEDDTEALQSAPGFDFEGTHTQLCRDRVRITFYGLRNNEALDFQDYVFQYSLNTDIIGFMSMPVIRDAKRTQTEIGVIAQKKEFSCEVSYYQQRLETETRQLIESVLVTYLPQPL
jgi:hypothetical protein